MDIDRNLAWCGMEFPAVGTLVCTVFDIGKTVPGKIPGERTQSVWQNLHAGGGIDQLGIFALEKPGEILAYLQAMFGLNGVGLMNTQAMFLGNEYLVLLVIALVACLPVGSLLVHRLKSSKTGPAMALYRVGEKVIPAALLILSVAYIVDASYNPFLYFRF